MEIVCIKTKMVGSHLLPVIESTVLLTKRLRKSQNTTKADLPQQDFQKVQVRRIIFKPFLHGFRNIPQWRKILAKRLK